MYTQFLSLPHSLFLHSHYSVVLDVSVEHKRQVASSEFSVCPLSASDSIHPSIRSFALSPTPAPPVPFVPLCCWNALKNGFYFIYIRHYDYYCCAGVYVHIVRWTRRVLRIVKFLRTHTQHTTRCNLYAMRLLLGEMKRSSCQQQLARASVARPGTKQNDKIKLNWITCFLSFHYNFVSSTFSESTARTWRQHSTFYKRGNIVYKVCAVDHYYYMSFIVLLKCRWLHLHVVHLSRAGRTHTHTATVKHIIINNNSVPFVCTSKSIKWKTRRNEKRPEKWRENKNI